MTLDTHTHTHTHVTPLARLKNFSLTACHSLSMRITQRSALSVHLLGLAGIDVDESQGHTHTAAPLSDYVARAFVLGLQCGTSPLREQVLNSTSSLTGTVLGSCLSPNSGQPPAQRT